MKAAGISAFLLIWVLIVAALAGYITHIMWFIHHQDQLLIGLIGLIPIVGVIHGWMLW